MNLVKFELWIEEYDIWVECKKVITDRQRAIHFYYYIQKQNNVKKTKIIPYIEVEEADEA